MISKNFARCLAKVSGDGYLCKRHIRYSNTCDDLINEFEEDIIKEFGEINFTRGIGNSGTPFTQLHKRYIIRHFLQYLDDFRSYAIKVPDEIKSSSIEVKKEYLRAFYDDEGCVALRIFSKTSEWKRSITLSSNSLTILNQIKSLLEEDFNIVSNRIFENRPESSYDLSHVLSVTGKENFVKFKERIGFLHPKKRKRLSLLIRSYNATYKNKMKFKKIKRELCDLARL